MNDKEREDPQPDHGKGPQDHGGRPVKHGHGSGSSTNKWYNWPA
jgi:hypothetical protein